METIPLKREAKGEDGWISGLGLGFWWLVMFYKFGVHYFMGLGIA